MRTRIRRLICRLRKHPLRTISIQKSGEVVDISRCRCGENAGTTKRVGQFPLRTREERWQVSG